MQNRLASDLSAFQGVIFDFDGTLLDLPVDVGAMRKALRRYWASEGVCPRIKSVREGLEIVEATAGAHSLRGSFEIIRRFEARAIGAAIPSQTMIQTVRDCAERGQHIGIFCSNHSDTVEEALALLDLTDQVNVVLGVDRVMRRKPNPEGLTRITESWRVERHEVAYVASRGRDRAMASAFGTPFFAIGA